MRDTTRHITYRRPPLSAPRSTNVVVAQPSMSRALRVDTLRRLVAAGQYQVNPRLLASRIMSLAGVPALDE